MISIAAVGSRLVVLNFPGKDVGFGRHETDGVGSDKKRGVHAGGIRRVPSAAHEIRSQVEQRIPNSNVVDVLVNRLQESKLKIGRGGREGRYEKVILDVLLEIDRRFFLWLNSRGIT